MNNRLRILRAEAGLSQGDLARLLGVSRQTVNAVETDKYDPSLPLALRMAKIFGVAVDEIFLDDWIAPARD
ncbi:helix-turn-helix transcriptional regulator [Sphingomonas sp.]|uniref:helix-turn-helix transcriptional regulator n=1 Tax=Sphingomonas sp. TaxID=28214 RepID=UPI000BC40997|nr:helix-turn-helix transcriptional regulator [Sphingomonas sp.]MBA4760448.1 helix-turn-helix transcriptional regulator [Sphingomonas sp.]OYX48908.1 MAG: transcriptional regulator [Sphingomonas sp. 32-66-10]